MTGAGHDTTAPSSASEQPEAMGACERELRAMVARAGYRTIRAAAQAANVDRHAVGRWMRGAGTPRRKPLARFAGVLGVPVELLDRLFQRGRDDRGRLS